MIKEITHYIAYCDICGNKIGECTGICIISRLKAGVFICWKETTEENCKAVCTECALRIFEGCLNEKEKQYTKDCQGILQNIINRHIKEAQDD